MKNLEQIRASSAWSAARSNAPFKGKEEGGNVAKTLPPLIMNHGLLQALAYATEKRGQDYRNQAENSIFGFLAGHLSERGIVHNCHDADSLLATLAEANSSVLRLATAEALAWLTYARRFIQ